MDDILVLLRTIDKCWGLPGGEVDTGEDIQKAAKRKLQENTGIIVDLSELHWLGMHRVDYRGSDSLEFFSYKITLPTKSNIVLNSAEYNEYRWMMPGDILRSKGTKDVRVFPGLIQVMSSFDYLSKLLVVGGCSVNVQRIS